MTLLGKHYGQRTGRRRRRLVLAASLILLAAGPSTGALAAGGPDPRGPAGCTVTPGSWPMYQGDPTHSADACSGINSLDASLLRPAWFTQLPDAVTATPAVADGLVFAGDYTGTLYALDQTTGAQRWALNGAGPLNCYRDATNPHADQHSAGMGKITSSAAVADIAGTPTEFVGVGASLLAVDARTGRCLWAQDTDPTQPTSAIEMESSPVVDTGLSPPEVLVGEDDNSSGGVAVTGLLAFNAQTGDLLWKYEPERDLTLTPAEFGDSDALTVSCGDGSADPTYCNSTNIPDLPPNSPTYADGCGDVWSSPALDTSFTDPAGDNRFEGSATQPAGWAPKQITATGGASKDGLAVFGTGNCGAQPTPAAALAHGDYADNQGIYAVDPATGVRVWSFIEPYNRYDNNPNEQWGGDTDFGSSAVIAHRASTKACPGGLAIEGSKAGFAYGICEATGTVQWANQIAQPGQGDQNLFGSIGGMIGAPTLGVIGARPTVFFTSAIPLPSSNDGLVDPGATDTNIAHCPGDGPLRALLTPVLGAIPRLPLCPDLSLLDNPLRIMSLHAVDAMTGRVRWNAPSLPTYAPATFTNGVVFDPQTIGFGIAAYNAATGLPIWAFPLAASPSSAAAIDGNSIFLGAGTDNALLPGPSLPPQLNGVWSFSTSAHLPKLNL